ncbi:MAG: AbrB/MazE/SpoVT family DNA-binding domain-containing protein [Mesorhizobium sp.]|nr:AbrB/MazE/SpoVT family DNA-binding domain-containing protein [Mesorhizobium sp.]
MEVAMNAHDDTSRTASLFRNGRSQAVRIPKEFEFEGEEVLITRDAKGKLTLEEVKRKPTLLEILATLKPLGPDDQFPDIDESDLLPLDDVRL